MKNYSHNRAPLVMLLHHNKTAIHKNGFSLIEMLMALLVASLLMAALAPVMIKKGKEGVSLTGEVNAPKLKKHEITYNSSDCSTIDAVNNVCTGQFTVPTGYNGTMYITTVGGGGGGGAAATSGVIEYKAPGEYSFVVPAGVTQLETTLITGGGGGGAGAQARVDRDWLTAGQTSWTTPDAIRLTGRRAAITACGGGGGAGGTSSSSWRGGGGGSGAYIANATYTLPATTYLVGIGGGGGGGSSYGLRAAAGGWNAGGGGGSDLWYGCHRGFGGGGGAFSGGGAGALEEQISGATFGLGGAAGWGDGNASPGANGTNSLGGFGAGGWATWGGTGGNGGAVTILHPGCTSWMNGGGGGGGSFYGGAGGGGGSGGYGTGGAGGGGATQLTLSNTTTPGDYIFQISGGGGGGGSSPATPTGEGASGGGGGGGGEGGGNGGSGGVNTTTAPTGGFGGRLGRFNTTGTTGTRGADGILASTGGGTGGTISTIFGAGSCNGGTAPVSNTAVGSGLPGAMRITYLDYGTGASGGGSGTVYGDRLVSVTPGEELKVIVGSGMPGGTAGSISAAGTVQALTEAICSENKTYIVRGATIIAGGSGSCNGGTHPGSSDGMVGNWSQTAPTMCKACGGGLYIQGYSTNFPIGNGQLGIAAPANWLVEHGLSANGGTSQSNAGPFANGSNGGRGGRVTTPYTSCTAGAGGIRTDMNGKNGGYPGCGGGGGFGLGNGGKGGDGYARIYWNPKQSGYGGGGGSGNNLAKQTITVNSGSVIYFKIGGGGKGGEVSTDLKTLTDGANGASTVFGTNDPNRFNVAAGGGFGGKSPYVSGGNILSGAGGSGASICKLGVQDLLICSGAIKGADGSDVDKKGGAGASSTYGAGGNGSGIGNGENSPSIAAGGGGAGVFTLSNPIVSTDNPASYKSTGGKGAPGKIIIEWYE